MKKLVSFFSVAACFLGMQAKAFTPEVGIPREGSDLFVMHWTMSLQDPGEPIPQKEVRRDVRRNSFPQSATLQQLQGDRSTSISSIYQINAPLPTYVPGLSALEAVLASGNLSHTRCECVVHYKNEPDLARRIGTSYAQGVTASMSLGIAQSSCAREAIAVNQSSAKAGQVDWYTLRQCETTAFQLPSNLKRALAHAVERGKKIEAKRPSESAQLARKVTSVLFSGLAGGLMWRARGGGIPLGSTQLARFLFVGVGYALIGAVDGMIDGDPTKALDGAIAGFLMLPGSLIGYDGNLDLTQGDTSGKTIYMMMNGAMRVALPAAYLSYRGYDATPMMLGGTSMGLCYNQSAEHLSRSGKGGEFFDGHTAYAEACTGAGFGVGLALALASQKRHELKPETLARDLERAVRDPGFQAALNDTENTPFRILAVEGAAEPGPVQVVMSADLKALKDICTRSLDSSEDFSIGGKANKSIAALAERSVPVKALVCKSIEDKSKPVDAFAPQTCFDLESIIANQYRQLCTGVGAK